MIFSLIHRFRRSVAYRRAQDDWTRSAVEVAFGQMNNEVVILQDLNITLKRGEHISILKGYQYALNLKRRLNASFELNGSQLHLKFSEFEFNINSAEELFIANEIFVNRCYEFHSSNKATVIDIGMNVGMASLYFANREDVLEVYSFEPFEPTYKLGILNFKLNFKTYGKIHSHNIGLGGNAREIEVSYSSENKGQVGMMGTELIKSKVYDLSKETLRIESAVHYFETIVKNAVDTDLIVKMDCEGAEFEIIPALKEASILGKIKLLMMEWHSEPESLIVLLKSEGFMLVRNNHSENIGMIYAIRS
ncbi:MAG: FkbM family methyltransferase [Bacteroidia bacterium]|jgi:FkbM family methyltransferase